MKNTSAGRFREFDAWSELGQRADLDRHRMNVPCFRQCRRAPMFWRLSALARRLLRR